MRGLVTATVLLVAPSAFAQADPASPPAAPPPTDSAPAPAAPPAPASTGLAAEQKGIATEKEETAGPKRAEDLDAEDAKERKPIVSREEGEDDAYGHGMQGGLRVGFVYGYRMVFRYDQSPFCSTPDPKLPAKDEQKFCGHGGQPALEAALSFAPTDGLEPFLWGRFGLGDGEPQTNTEPIRMLGAGLRIYTMSDSRLKILVEPAVGYEFEGGAGNPDYKKPPTPGADAFEPEYKKDMVFRLHAGPQYDPAKAIGIYFSAGMTVGVLRAIHANLEGILGIQLRGP